jgi:UDP-galactopyranose mutase
LIYTLAEDDIWKVYSTFSEFDNYKNLYTNAVKSGKLKNMPTDLEIMKQATKIVRDTLPNYAYVGDFIKIYEKNTSWKFYVMACICNKIWIKNI